MKKILFILISLLITSISYGQVKKARKFVSDSLEVKNFADINKALIDTIDAITTVTDTLYVQEAEEDLIPTKAATLGSDGKLKYASYVDIDSVSSPYVIKGTDYTALRTDGFIEMTNATDTVTLPAGVTGKIYTVINVTAGDITVIGTGSEEIGNASTALTNTISTGAAIRYIFNGTSWRIF